MRAICLAFAAAVALAWPAQAATLVYQVTLGPEVAGATGSGVAEITYDDLARTLSIDTTWSGLSGVTTVAHIHCCVAVAGSGTAGIAVTPGTLPGFPTSVSSGSYLTVLDLSTSTTYASAFLNLVGGTDEGAEAMLLAGMNSSRAYLNIHTTMYPGGEIRGFLTPVPEPGLGVLLLAAGILAGFARLRFAEGPAQ